MLSIFRSWSVWFPLRFDWLIYDRPSHALQPGHMGGSCLTHNQYDQPYSCLSDLRRHHPQIESLTKPGPNKRHEPPMTKRISRRSESVLLRRWGSLSGSIWTTPGCLLLYSYCNILSWQTLLIERWSWDRLRCSRMFIVALTYTLIEGRNAFPFLMYDHKF